MTLTKKAAPRRLVSQASKTRSAPAPKTAELHELAEPKAKLTDLAYEQIEEAIITMRIPPGSVVSELSLSEMRFQKRWMCGIAASISTVSLLTLPGSSTSASSSSSISSAPSR